jgi:hypothetical protein
LSLHAKDTLNIALLCAYLLDKLTKETNNIVKKDAQKKGVFPLGNN